MHYYPVFRVKSWNWKKQQDTHRLEPPKHPDVVCVDPPRKGLAEDVVDTIADMGPERVVYVSCDPGTLGRDVKRFAGRGYTLKKAVAVDMFPRTAHVETVARLERS